MEQHAVPRNISGFQFRLIGDMTLRQFGYLAGGALVAFLIFKVIPLPPIFKYPLVGIVGFAGFAFAFLPVQERPLDKWLLAFIKSINSPTQYLWQKESTPLEILIRTQISNKNKNSTSHIEAHIDAQQKLKAYLATVPVQPHQTLNIKEKKYIDQTLSLFNTSDSPPVTPQMPPPKTPIPPQPVADDSADIKNQLSQILAEKETLAKELDQLKSTFKKATEPNVVTPLVDKAAPPGPTIKKLTPQSAVNAAGMPTLSQIPNMIMGVVKDMQKRFLPNIIITVKDSKDNPLRAFKTNSLGQFSTATPLASGIYHLEAEDPLKRYTFDIAEITLLGKVFLPLEITAKSQKELLRDKLSKELFGAANTL